MQYTRSERVAQAALVVVALVFAIVVAGVIFRGGGGAPGAAVPTAAPTVKPPDVKIAHDPCCAQAARFLNAGWESSAKVDRAAVTLIPDPGFACAAQVFSGGLKGSFGCAGLLRGATEYVATLALTTIDGTFKIDHKFTTMADKLTGVQWFTEFENPSGDPLACAAASCRIVQFFTAGKDPMTAEAILALGRQFNKSADPGLDPVGIATVIKRMEPLNNYHYYRYDTREDATFASVYWLLRSGKPVLVISLAGQHGPVLVGFQGAYGTYYDDPANKVSGVIVEDPQRGDMDPRTQSHRPDKYRTPGFQTGQLIGLDEWYRDEWWLGFAYQASIKMPDGTFRNVERNDGAYPTPHWGGKFVILVDDGDADWSSDKEGRVKFR